MTEDARASAGRYPTHLGPKEALWDTWSEMPGRAAALLVFVGLGTLGGSCGLGALGLAGCGHGRPARNLDLDQIHILDGARLRTDVVGEGRFASTASFVLVDAENAAAEGAYVTLGGELTDATGASVGELRAQSLWIPPHEARTFALVDGRRAARPTAVAARIRVYGAVIPDEPPRAHIADLHAFDDRGKIVVQAYLANTADRPGRIMVIGVFHDTRGRPMTRPFQLIEIAANDRRIVQFVGPQGSTRGTIFVGDVVY